ADLVKGALLQALKDSEVEVRRNAALALAATHCPEAAQAVPVLLDALRRGDVHLKRQAVLGLGNLGPAAAVAVPDLRKALDALDQALRLNAAFAFTRLGKAGEPAVPDLLRLVVKKDEAVPVRQQAAGAIRSVGYGPGLRDAMPTLLRVVADTKELRQVRERALWPVGVWEAEAEERGEAWKVLNTIVKEPFTKDTKMVIYHSAHMLGMT